MKETLRKHEKEAAAATKHTLGALALEQERPELPVFTFKHEVHSRLDNRELLDKILKKAESLRTNEAPFLLTGFRGGKVRREKTFGDRWHTFAVPEEEAKNPPEYSLGTDHDPVGYAFSADHQWPAVGVFDSSKLRLIEDSPALLERFRAEEGEDSAPVSYQYGVEEGNLDGAVVALFYFAPQRSR